MSRFAVSCEQLAIVAHLDDVIFPSNQSSSRFRTLIWRSFRASAAARSQKGPLTRTVARMLSAPMIARSRQSRNHRTHAVTSVPPLGSNPCGDQAWAVSFSYATMTKLATPSRYLPRMFVRRPSLLSNAKTTPLRLRQPQDLISKPGTSVANVVGGGRAGLSHQL